MEFVSFAQLPKVNTVISHHVFLIVTAPLVLAIMDNAQVVIIISKDPIVMVIVVL